MKSATLNVMALALALVFMPLTHQASAATPPPGCDDIQVLPVEKLRRIQPNTTVDIVIENPNDVPQDYLNSLRSAIPNAAASLSNKVDGIVFRNAASEGDNSSIMVRIQPKNPAELNLPPEYHDNIGAYSASNGSNSWMQTGVIVIYMNQAHSDCGGLCLDPQQPELFNIALQQLIEHELGHALGADDSEKANFMYEAFFGKNNVSAPPREIDCVTQRLQQLLSGGGAPPPWSCN